jgi:hypothetical protein
MMRKGAHQELEHLLFEIVRTNIPSLRSIVKVLFWSILTGPGNT